MYRMLRLLPLFALALLATQPALAKKLYKYQDAQGRWHYSDSPPADERPVETRQLTITRPAPKVGVRQLGSERDPVFHIINEYFGPIELEFSLGENFNVTADPPLPRRFIVPGASQVRAVSLHPTEPGRSWSYQTRYRYMLGDPRADHRPPGPYRVPFPVGLQLPVSQGFGGSFSHNTPSSRYAVDIGMPEGTDIVAARDGIVMEIANDFFSGGVEEKYAERANLIRILHDDGTMAVYGHLQLESARVSPGNRVSRGQVIARSGNTGFSSGPHLHFVIQLNTGLHMESVPFEFAGRDGRGFEPQARMVLTAYP